VVDHVRGSRLHRVWRENWLLLTVIGAVLAAFLALRTTGSPVGSVAEVDALLRNGQPTFVEFYSNT
jgi:hypothetical protein